MKRYRAGIIGCGRIASTSESNHADAHVANPRIDLVAGSDLIEEKLKAFSEKYGVEKLYTNYEDMLDNENLDIVSVTTWPDQHCKLTIAAAERGINVICEKPMALTLAEADQMLEACDKSGAKLAINHQRRCCPYHLRAKELLDEGAIGRLIAVRGEGGGGGGFGLMNTATHLFDQIRIFADDVDWVWAHVTKDGRDITPDDIHQTQRGGGIGAGDKFTAYFRFKNGSYATVDSFGDFGSELIGTEGRILVRQRSRAFATPFAILRPGKGSGEWEPLDPPEEKLKHSSLYWTVQEMIDAIEENRDHRSSGKESRAALEMIMAVYESQICQARIQLPLEFTEHPLERWFIPLSA